MLNGQLKFELPEVLAKPHVVKDFFTPELFERVKTRINSLGMGPGGHLQFHTMLARWESPVSFDEETERYCLERAREIFAEPKLEKAYFYAVRYQKHNGCIPHLWEHTDQNGTQTTIDITIENTAKWGLLVEGELFSQDPNDAIIFCGQQHTHARPPYPTDDEESFTTVIFLHFTQPDHWIQKNRSGIYEYGVDGDIRFFNKNRYFALPDPPLAQPVCSCHDYSQVLSLYNQYFGDAVDSKTEIVPIEIRSKVELAPGIVKYEFDKESARTLKGLVHNSVNKMWEQARVYGNGPVVNTSARNCSNYFLKGHEITCHPQDPIRRLYESLERGMPKFINDYRSRFRIPELSAEHWVLLRYEQSNMFHAHVDDAKPYPRVVSMSMFLNDDFDGGEIEFPEYGVKIKPEAGTCVFFSSSFPYIHEVHPVTRGVRYAIVRWYGYPRG